MNWNHLEEEERGRLNGVLYEHEEGDGVADETEATEDTDDQRRCDERIELTCL